MTEAKTKAPAAEAAKATSANKIAAAANFGAKLSEGDIAKARKEGALAAETEAAKASYIYSTDGAQIGDPADAPRSFIGSDDIMQYVDLLSLDPEAFEAAIAADADSPIGDEKVYGLGALERNGRNRTPYVQAVMKRLDLTAEELPGGGPGYTNDVRPITKL